MHITLRTLVNTLLALMAGLLWQASYAADLRVAVASDITSMDPHAVNIQPNNNVGWHVYDALVHVDADARIVPGLAQSWRAIDDTTWEFKLRRNVRFHDGSPLTAEDVLFSIERAQKLPNGQYAGFVQRLIERSAPDPFTLRFKTATPYAMVPYDLNSIFIVSKKSAANATTEDFNAGRAAIGTGPFRLTRFARGDRVELTKNTAYWGGAPAWDKLTIRIIPADPARIAALLAGDVDMIENIPTADLARIRADKRFRTAQKVSWRTIFFHADQSREVSPFVTDRSGKPLPKNPLRDVNVRRAISKAINRQAIVERLMENAAIPASNLVSPPVFGHVASIKPEGYEPEAAKQILAQAGYPDGFALTLHAPNNRYVNDDQIAQSVAQMLARVGISTKVETMPINVYLPRAHKGEFSFAMLGWGSFSGDLAMRALVAAPDSSKGFGAWNWSRYSNPTVDKMLESGFAMVDEKKREANAREAATIALRDQAVVPLHHQIAIWAMKNNLNYVARTDEYTFAHHVK